MTAETNAPRRSLSVKTPCNKTPAAIAALHAEGVRIIMLTGDHLATAEAVARELGIDEVEANVLPEQKGEVVERLRREGRIVAIMTRHVPPVSIAG